MQEPEEKDETVIDSEFQKKEKDDFKKQSGVEVPRMIGFIHEEVFGEEDNY